MREILFRAYVNDKGKIYDIKKIDFDYGMVWFEEENKPTDTMRMFDQIELMQFTSLTDKNGAKIFEGDILKGCWNTIFEVYYDDCLLQFRAKTVDGFNKDIDYYGYPHQIEVIGNIYDNKELLENAK